MGRKKIASYWPIFHSSIWAGSTENDIIETGVFEVPPLYIPSKTVYNEGNHKPLGGNVSMNIVLLESLGISPELLDEARSILKMRHGG